jgi:hypothetical protein
MAAFAIFCRVLLLVLNAAAILHHRLLPQLRRRPLLSHSAAILMVLGANDDIHALAAAGFLIWVVGVALLLLALTTGRFPGPGAAAPACFAAQIVQAAAGALF